MYEIKKEIDKEDGTRTLVLGDYIEPTHCVSCLICGKSIIDNFHFDVEICDECKQAVAWVKDKMMRKNKNKSNKRFEIE